VVPAQLSERALSRAGTQHFRLNAGEQPALAAAGSREACHAVLVLHSAPINGSQPLLRPLPHAPPRRIALFRQRLRQARDSALGIELFTGASIVGTGIVRCVQGMPWAKGPMDLCAMVVEKSLGKHALRCGYVLELLPCTDTGSEHFGRRLARAAPAGKRDTDKVDVAFGAKFRFKAKPVEAAAGAAVEPLVLPSEVSFPLGGVGACSGSGKLRKRTNTSSESSTFASSSW